MPGPCNSKKKKKLQAKKQKQKQVQAKQAVDSLISSNSLSPEQLPLPSSSPTHTYEGEVPTQLLDVGLPQVKDVQTPAQELPSPNTGEDNANSISRMHQYLASIQPDPSAVPSLLRTPCVEDLGDGPRVRDVKTFLASKIAAPVSLDDPLCAEFGQREVLEMLCCVLPEETAMIAWYNLSRLKSRVCPACKRLYHLGDAIPELFADEEIDDTGDDIKTEKHERAREESQKLHNEQLISGICSALCYFLVAHNYPGAIRSTFGRRAEDIPDDAWDELNGPGLRGPNTGTEDRMGLGMLLRMTRCHDMGLEQLILPGLAEAVSDGSEYEDGDGDEWEDEGEGEGEEGEGEGEEDGDEGEDQEPVEFWEATPLVSGGKQSMRMKIP